jgi:hypothetical protein
MWMRVVSIFGEDQVLCGEMNCDIFCHFGIFSSKTFHSSVIDFEDPHSYDECMVQLYDQADRVQNLQIFKRDNYGHSFQSSLNSVSKERTCDHLIFTKRGIRYARINCL